MRNWRNLAAVLTTAGLASVTLMAGSPAPEDDVKQVYSNKCSVCHGEDGAGKTAKGKKLKMKDIRSAEVEKMTDAKWLEAILKGSGENMAPFEKELGADMAKKLVTYMRDLARKK
ncbi:MAG TPA: cytochrome c [Terriglobia bacterium]|nr:cytochrome c [Terriglobia bacterium]